MESQGDALLSGVAHHASFDALEVAADDAHAVVGFIADIPGVGKEDVVVADVHEVDEIHHLPVADGQGRVGAGAGLSEVVVIVADVGQCRGVAHVPVCLLRRGIDEEEVGEHGYHGEHPLRASAFLRLPEGEYPLLRYIYLGAVARDVFRRLGSPAVGGPKDEPLFRGVIGISHRHPFCGIVCVGGDKSSIFKGSASVCDGISQCLVMHLRGLKFGPKMLSGLSEDKGNERVGEYQKNLVFFRLTRMPPVIFYHG